MNTPSAQPSPTRSNLTLPSFLAIGLILLIAPTVMVLAAATHFSDPSTIVAISQQEELESQETQTVETVAGAGIEPSSTIAKK